MNVAAIFKKNTVSISLIVVLAIILGVNLKHVLERQRFEQDVKVALRKSLAEIPGADLADVNVEHDDAITAVVRSTNEMTKERARQIAAYLPTKKGKHPDLHIRVVRVQDVSS